MARKRRRVRSHSKRAKRFIAFPPVEIKHYEILLAPRESNARRRERTRLNAFANSAQPRERRLRPRLVDRSGSVVR
jgi:hypothetical protein